MPRNLERFMQGFADAEDDGSKLPKEGKPKEESQGDTTADMPQVTQRTTEVKSSRVSRGTAPVRQVGARPATDRADRRTEPGARDVTRSPATTATPVTGSTGGLRASPADTGGARGPTPPVSTVQPQSRSQSSQPVQSAPATARKPLKLNLSRKPSTGSGSAAAPTRSPIQGSKSVPSPEVSTAAPTDVVSKTPPPSEERHPVTQTRVQEPVPAASPAPRISAREAARLAKEREHQELLARLEALFPLSETPPEQHDKWIATAVRASESDVNNIMNDKVRRGRFRFTAKGELEILPEMDTSGKGAKEILSSQWIIK